MYQKILVSARSPNDYLIENTIANSTAPSLRTRRNRVSGILQVGQLDLLLAELVNLDLQRDVRHLDLQHTRDEFCPARFERSKLCSDVCLEGNVSMSRPSCGNGAQGRKPT